jgi:replicative DNA helicase
LIGTFDGVILQHLSHNEIYARKVVAFLKEDYFRSRTDRVLFDVINSYIDRYNSVPSMDALAVDLSNRIDLTDAEYKEAQEFLKVGKPDETTSLDWLVDQTENFCKERALNNALMSAYEIATDKTGKSKIATGAIPQMLMDALSVSFDQKLGHDYLEDIEDQLAWMHREQPRIPFHLDLLNKATRGGVLRDEGFLGIFLAGTNGGKSMTMCDFAANHLMAGWNILYITLEMSQHQITERIDANLLDVEVDHLKLIKKEQYLAKKRAFVDKTKGRLIVKLFPGGSTSVTHFRHLLQELRIKKKFKPDLIYVDYIGEMASSRIKMDGNSYNYQGAITSELRGLSTEVGIPIITAVQTNRGGFDNSALSLTHVAESFAIPQKADLMIGLYGGGELEKMNQMMMLVLKNRNGSRVKYQKFVVGANIPKMQYYDLEPNAQNGLTDDGETYDLGTGELLGDLPASGGLDFT